MMAGHTFGLESQLSCGAAWRRSAPPKDGWVAAWGPQQSVLEDSSWTVRRAAWMLRWDGKLREAEVGMPHADPKVDEGRSLPAPLQDAPFGRGLGASSARRGAYRVPWRSPRSGIGSEIRPRDITTRFPVAPVATGWVSPTFAFVACRLPSPLRLSRLAPRNGPQSRLRSRIPTVEPRRVDARANGGLTYVCHDGFAVLPRPTGRGGAEVTRVTLGCHGQRRNLRGRAEFLVFI
jgi:hypothetical protein